MFMQYNILYDRISFITNHFVLLLSLDRCPSFVGNRNAYWHRNRVSAMINDKTKAKELIEWHTPIEERLKTQF